jgi:DNA polymerase-1
VALPDTEADDLMASYAYAARAQGWECVLATADKDLFQIVAPDIRIYTTQKTELANPKDTHALLDAERVRRKWGVCPEQLGDLLSLVGDSADNIPGIPGIGPKGAAALLNAHGSLEAAYANLETVSPVKLREKLAAGREQLEQNREMVRLDLNLPLPAPIEALRIRPQFEPLFDALQKAGLRSLETEMRKEEAESRRPQQTEFFS